MMTKNLNRGSIALLCSAIVLPMLLLFLTLCLGVAKYYAEVDRVQQTLDDAVIRSYRFLPYRAEAEQALRRYLVEAARLPGDFRLEVASDRVGVSYQGVADLGLGGLFSGQAALPFSVQSTARGTVAHVAVMVDASAYLAPLPGGSAWGSEAQWPVSNIFADTSLMDWSGQPIEPRILTQQCFNPIFSGLKLAALRFTDYTAGFSKNSVSLAFFPGTLDEVDVVKDARAGGLRADRTPLSYFSIANSPYSSNIWCLAAAEQDQELFRLPDPARSLPGGPSTGGFIDSDTLTFDESRIGELSIREVLWSRAAGPRIGDIGEALGSMTALLAEGGALNSSLSANALARSAVRVGAIFMADLPYAGGKRFPDPLVLEVMSSRLRQLAGVGDDAAPSSKVTALYFVLLSGEEHPLEAAEVEQFNAYLSELTSGDGAIAGLRSRVVLAARPEELVQGVVRSLVLENNTAVIDR